MQSSMRMTGLVVLTCFVIALTGPRTLADDVPSNPGWHRIIDPFYCCGFDPYPGTWDPPGEGEVIFFDPAGGLVFNQAVMGPGSCIGYSGTDFFDAGFHIAEYELDLNYIEPDSSIIHTVFDFSRIDGPVFEHQLNVVSGSDILVQIWYPDDPLYETGARAMVFANLTWAPLAAGMATSECVVGPITPRIEVWTQNPWECHAFDLLGWPDDWQYDSMRLCIEKTEEGLRVYLCNLLPGTDGTVDSFHMVGTLPNTIPVGNVGKVEAVALQNLRPVSAELVEFRKVFGNSTFTSGVITPNGVITHAWTDLNGRAWAMFSADEPGLAIIEATVQATLMSGEPYIPPPPTYYVFQIVPAGSAPEPRQSEFIAITRDLARNDDGLRNENK